jgi:molybdopterin biosynthesis enzyme
MQAREARRNLRVLQRGQRVSAEQQPLVVASGLERVHAQRVTVAVV